MIMQGFLPGAGDIQIPNPGGFMIWRSRFADNMFFLPLRITKYVESIVMKAIYSPYYCEFTGGDISNELRREVTILGLYIEDKYFAAEGLVSRDIIRQDNNSKSVNRVDEYVIKIGEVITFDTSKVNNANCVMYARDYDGSGVSSQADVYFYLNFNFGGKLCLSSK